MDARRGYVWALSVVMAGLPIIGPAQSIPGLDSEVDSCLNAEYDTEVRFRMDPWQFWNDTLASMEYHLQYGDVNHTFNLVEGDLNFLVGDDLGTFTDIQDDPRHHYLTSEDQLVNSALTLEGDILGVHMWMTGDLGVLEMQPVGIESNADGDCYTLDVVRSRGPVFLDGHPGPTTSCVRIETTCSESAEACEIQDLTTCFAGPEYHYNNGVLEGGPSSGHFQLNHVNAPDASVIGISKWDQGGTEIAQPKPWTSEESDFLLLVYNDEPIVEAYLVNGSMVSHDSWFEYPIVYLGGTGQLDAGDKAHVTTLRYGSLPSTPGAFCTIVHAPDPSPDTPGEGQNVQFCVPSPYPPEPPTEPLPTPCIPLAGDEIAVGGPIKECSSDPQPPQPCVPSTGREEIDRIAGEGVDRCPPPSPPCIPTTGNEAIDETWITTIERCPPPQWCIQAPVEPGPVADHTLPVCGAECDESALKLWGDCQNNPPATNYANLWIHMYGNLDFCKKRASSSWTTAYKWGASPYQENAPSQVYAGMTANAAYLTRVWIFSKLPDPSNLVTFTAYCGTVDSQGNRDTSSYDVGTADCDRTWGIWADKINGINPDANGPFWETRSKNHIYVYFQDTPLQASCGDCTGRFTLMTLVGGHGHAFTHEIGHNFWGTHNAAAAIPVCNAHDADKQQAPNPGATAGPEAEPFMCNNTLCYDELYEMPGGPWAMRFSDGVNNLGAGNNVHYMLCEIAYKRTSDPVKHDKHCVIDNHANQVQAALDLI